METVKAIQKRYASPAIFCAIIFCAVMIGIGHPAIGKGFLLGTLLSIVNFILIGASLPKRLAETKRAATGKSFFSLAVRFAIMGGGLYFALSSETFSFAATAAGLFSVQITILADHIIVNRIRQRFFKAAP